MNRARGTAVVALLALPVLVAGCSSVPTTSDVKKGREVRFEQEEPFVRALAQDPRAGDDPLAIVQGFLSASAECRHAGRPELPRAGSAGLAPIHQDHGVRRQ